MGSLEKIVKLACKPKAAPPKSKYLEPIIAATWDEEGAVSDVCRALQPRFREPNAIVVFKALIVLHTMMRNGSTDNVLSHLSSSEVLHLRNVSAGQWEGYHPPQNMQHYAIYLDSRIRAYRELKHDAVQVQSEHQRDLRVAKGIDKERSDGGLKRGKTLAGRKLRIMTVEKGLLRETKAVQKQIDALVECRFYLDNLEDALTVTAFRALVQDLLILFSAANEGVINVLEHYFEMSRTDAESALAVYRHFCKQCEKVVEYLGVAKKLQNIINVQIPNMKHAPLSLAGALKDYLDDPNFEQNRIEYKLQKDSADKNGKAPVVKKSSDTEKSETATSSQPAASGSTSSSAPANGSPVPQNVTDFFQSIEEAQHPMFGASPTSATPLQAFNPFMQMQATGAFGASPFGQPQQPFGQAQQPFLQPQQQPFLVPQATGFNPFQAQLPQQQATMAAQGMSLAPQGQHMLRPQATGMLQPQMTGANPFRASIAGQAGPFGMQSQPTGQPFGQPGPFSMQTQNGPFGQAMQPQATGQPFGQAPQSAGADMFNQQPQLSAMSTASSMSTFSTNNPFPSALAGSTSLPGPVQAGGPGGAATPFSSPFASAPGPGNGIVRPGSAPLLSQTSASPAPIQQVKTHQTGSRNPFGPVLAPPPPVPKVPTMAELLGGVNPGSEPKSAFEAFEARQNALSRQKQDTSGSGLGQGSVISSVASSFAFKPSGDSGATSPLAPQTTASTSSGFSDSVFSALSSNATGMTANSASSTPSIAFSLAPQPTGFGGIKAFKPSSSFGASLLENTPGSTPAATGGLTTGLGSLSLGSTPASGASGSAFGSSLGGLGSSTTGSANTPSFINGPNGPSSGLSTGTPGSALGSGTGLGNGGTLSPLGTQATGMGAFGGSKTMLGTGLRPQMTGSGLGGAANPFRSTVFGTGLGGASLGNGLGGSGPGSGHSATGSLGGGPLLGAQPTGMGTFGSSTFGAQPTSPNAFAGSPFGSAFTPGVGALNANPGAFGGASAFGQQHQQQQGQQQQNSMSLI